MSEETKKIEQTGQEVETSNLSEPDLDQVAGGAPGDPLQGIDVSIGKKPKRPSDS